MYVVFNVALVVVSFFLFQFLFVLPTKQRPLPEDPKTKKQKHHNEEKNKENNQYTTTTNNNLLVQ